MIAQNGKELRPSVSERLAGDARGSPQANECGQAVLVKITMSLETWKSIVSNGEKSIEDNKL